MRERLAELAMDGATFEAALSDRDGYGPSGGDEVEFLIAPEPRRAGRPAARDGLGRRALARDARADGRRGRGRARGRWSSTRSTPASAARPRARSASSCARWPRAARSICITHLPQIASLADRHFTIVKDVSGDTARTTVTQLERGDVVGELVRMLGADGDDAAARRHAHELLKAA